MKIYRQGWSVLAFFLGIFWVSRITIFAQDSTGLTLSPALKEAVLTGGELYTTSVRLINTSTIPLPIKVTKGDLLSGDPELATQVKGAREWIQVEPSDFILQPKESKVINIQIFPPIDAAPGGHYASLVFNPLIPEGLVTSGTISIPRVSLQMLLLVKGDIREKLEINSMSAPAVVWGGSKAVVTVLLKNSGNTHLMPETSIFSGDYNFKGQKEDRLLVLPQSSRNFSFTVEVRKWGKYAIKAEALYGANKVSTGVHTIYVYFLPGVGQLILFVTLTAALIFIIMNYRRVATAVTVLLHGKSK